MGSKTRRFIWSALAVALISFAGAALSRSQNVPSSPSFRPNVAQPGSLSLITEPGDGMTPIKEAIESASSSIDLVMYEFDDTQLEQLLTQEAQKGVAVRVILNNGYFGAGSALNQQAYEYLRDNGVQVHWSPEYFALTHEKSLVIDGKEAIIMTFNFTPHYYKSDRDFGVIDTDTTDIVAMGQTFDMDWFANRFSSHDGNALVWSPDSRAQLLDLINAATSSLDIYNEEMNDPKITSALEAAAKRGVNVQVDMTYSANWKSAFEQLSQAGVHSRTYTANAPLYIHAKVIIADGAKAFVGSENFSTGSLDQNRELGIIVSDPPIVSRLEQTFQTDWQGATPFLDTP